jgi:hypothetical protein
VRRRLALVVLAAIVALTTTGVAISAGPSFRDRDTFSDTDTDFCGTGETVLVEGSAVANIWLGSTGGDDEQEIKITLNLMISYTNPETGATVFEHWAVLRTNEIISGLESGVHTHEFTERGLKATYVLVGGGLITRDAGSLTYRVTFDENDNVTNFEIVQIHGPHPQFIGESGGFCETLIPALDLE